MSTKTPVFAAAWGLLALAQIAWGQGNGAQGQQSVVGVPGPAVALGYAHGVAVSSSGNLVTWALTPAPSEVPAAGVTYISAAAGNFCSCGLRSDGSLYCFASEEHDDSPASDIVRETPQGQGFAALACGAAHCCTVPASLSEPLLCWGRASSNITSVPEIPVGESWSAVSAGSRSTCGILNPSGQLVCFGSNSDGQLDVPQLSPGETWTNVAVGSTAVCGLTSNDAIRCWGSNMYDQRIPPTLPNGTVFKALAAGLLHFCGITSDVSDSLVCWGSNTSGATDVPPAPEGEQYVAVNAGPLHTAAITSGGRLVVFGADAAPELGLPPGMMTNVPFGTYQVPPPAEDNSAVQTATDIMSSDSDGGSSSSNIGAIVGGIVGGIAAVAAFVVGSVYLRRRRRHKSISSSQSVLPIATKSRQGSAGSNTGSPFSTEESQARSLSDPLGPRKASLTSERSGASKASRASSELDAAFQMHPSQLQVVLRPDGSEAVLGAGTYGRVVRAVKDGVTDVALKIIDYSSRNELREVTMRELSLMQTLHDPNVVHLFAACVLEDEKKILLAMEYMEGGDLHSALRDSERRKVLTWYGNGRRIALTVTQALCYLHSRRIIHRDVKPKNIFLNNDLSRGKLGDVGISRRMEATDAATMTGVYTFPYAAPEVLLAQRYDSKVDIYSLGVTFWEIVTHEAPMRGSMRLVKVPEECPQGVANLIDRCLEMDPSARPTAVEIFKELEALQNIA